MVQLQIKKGTVRNLFYKDSTYRPSGNHGREGLTFTFNFRGHLVDYSLLALRLSQLNSATLI